MIKKRIIIIFGLIALTMAFAACNDTGGQSAPAHTVVDVDREGYPISLPDEINTIISIGPSNTEILVALGFGGQIIAADTFSSDVAGIAPGISVLDMMGLDAEFIIDANPDIVFVAGITRTHGEDHPLRPVSDTGIAVVYIPTAAKIADVIEDIRFMAAVLGVQEVGEGIVADMLAGIAEISQIAATISDRRTVYFEISPAPHMWSIGGGTFQHEMMELVGAINIFSDRDGWFGVSDEVFFEHNPDVILTSTDFIDDPIGEIMGRPGWGAITAVQNGAVYFIDTNASSRPSHHIITGLWQIARAVYPEYFE